MKKLILLLSVLCSTYSHATIVVFGMRPSWSTVQAAQKAAAVRGEDVLYYPRANTPSLDKEGFRHVFDELERSGKEITSLVFSGHDGSGNFWGDNGDIYKDDIAELLNEKKADGTYKYAKLRKNTKSLVLRGCYSATKEEVLDNANNSMESWRDAFPNLDYVFGFEGAAPSGNKPHSKNFVEGVLKLEHENRSLKNEDELRRLLLEIDLLKWTGAAAWHRTSCSSEYYYSQYKPTKHGIVLEEGIVPPECASQTNINNSRQHLRTIEKYWKGEEAGYELPPTQHQGTDMRRAYSFLQGHSHCYSQGHWPSSPYANRQKTLALLYFDYIRDNFLENQDIDGLLKAIKEVNKSVSDKYKIREDLTKEKMKSLSRKEWRQLVKKMNDLVEGPERHSLKFGTVNLHYHKMDAISNMMDEVLVNLEYNAIPSAWIDHHHSDVAIDEYEYLRAH